MIKVAFSSSQIPAPTSTVGYYYKNVHLMFLLEPLLCTYFSAAASDEDKAKRLVTVNGTWLCVLRGVAFLLGTVPFVYWQVTGSLPVIDCLVSQSI